MGTKNIRVLAVLCGLALAASAPAAATEASGAVWQVGGAVLCEAGIGLLGYAITRDAFGDAGGSDPICGTHGVNGAGALIGITVLGAYPLAAAAGTYFVGEKAGGPAANGGATFGITTFAAYGQTLALAFGASMLGMAEGIDSADAFTWALAVDAATKPVLTTYVYHKVKKPASPADSRLVVEPYVSVAAASDGRTVPIYGLKISF